MSFTFSEKCGEVSMLFKPSEETKKKFELADMLFKQYEKIKKENDEVAGAFQCKQGMETGEYKIYKNYLETIQDANFATEGLHKKLLCKIYTGDNGTGKLFLVTGNTDNTIPAKVRRLLFIGENGKNKENRNYIGFSQQIYWFTEPECFNNYYDLENLRAEWAEVKLTRNNTSDSELEALFHELKKEFPINFLMKAFPDFFSPPLQTGEIFSIPSYFNRSERLTCFGCVLPTLRLAIMANNNDMLSIQPDTAFYGITDCFAWTPDFSAKGELRNRDELFLPNEAEQTFLSKKEIKLANV